MGHVMIPHHHDNLMAFKFSSRSLVNDNNSQFPKDQKHDTTKEHHKFPRHSHAFSVNDYDLSRLNQGENSNQNQNPGFLVAIQIIHSIHYDLSGSKYYNTRISFLIPSLFTHGAFALRAPPVFA